MKTVNYSKKFTLLFLTTGLAFFLILIFILFYEFSKQYEIINLERAQHIYQSDKKNFQSKYIYYEKILFSINKNKFFSKYLNEPTINNLEDAQSIFLTLTDFDKNIMQLRYIDEFGKEIIRVDRDKHSDKIKLVKRNDLQDKSNRDYFSDTMKLKIDKVNISKIDLNIENGKIEIPYRPTWRFSIPIYLNDTPKGILIINIFGLEILSNIVDSDNFIIDIFDQDGDLLISSDKSLNFWTKYTNRTNEKREYIYKGFFLDAKNGEKIYLGYIPSFNLVDFFFLISSKLIVLILIMLIVSFILAYLLARIPNRLYKEIKNQEKMIIRQSRLSAMGEMINSIAHQWRQPLNRINLSSKVLKTVIDENSQGLSQDNKQLIEKKFAHINDNVYFMSNTIEDFMNYFKPSKEKRVFNLIGIINKSLSLNENLKKIKIDIKVPNELKINGYENEFAQVLLVIFENSVDNFKIKQTGNPALTIEAQSFRKNIIVRIMDNGGGIPQEYIDKIFEPYFSTKDEKEGTGLGLYLAKMIIEDSMNGKIDVISYNNQTTFSITLPKGF